MSPVAKPAQDLVMYSKYKFVSVYKLYIKESISKEMNNDDLNLHVMTKLPLHVTRE